jgi:arylamine N-acetyltransferase
MNVEAYLARIGFTGKPDGGTETLGKLQELHLQAVPYENLDIMKGVPLSLQLESIYDKIVGRGRGGYCFELNALFGWLLRELGYGVTDYFARFWRDEANTPPKRRHQVLRVEAEGRVFLCDVGVGGIVPRRPLLLQEGLEQQQGGESYRFDRDAEFGWMLMEKKKDGWARLFSFTEEPQLPKDYLMASFWCEHAPDSVFKNNRIVAMHTKDGRNTVWNEEFRLFRPDGVHAFTPASEAEDAEALKKYFGIVV